MKNLTLKSHLVGLLIVIVALFVVFSILVWNATAKISIAADQMGQGKDVVADILPPPLYVLEAEFTVLQLQDAAPNEVPAMIDKLKALKKDYDERNAFWEKEDLVADVKASLLGQQKQAADAFWKIVLGDYLNAVNRGDKAQMHLLSAQIHKLYLAHRNGVDATVKLSSSYADNTLNSLHDTSAWVRWLVLFVALAGTFIAFAGMLLVMREIMRRLGEEPLVMQASAKRIAAGDLTEILESPAGKENSLYASIIEMQRSLRGAILQSRESAEALAMQAQKLSQNSLQVLESSVQQNDAAASMAASVEQVTVSIGTMASNAANTKELAEETGTLSTEGKSLLDTTIVDIQKISDSVSSSTEVIKNLAEQSQRISSITSVISEIADQTNLLALNAAIEAARAGEQGRGFAVVADEVRKLAERTADSTREISDMVTSILQGTHEAVSVMAVGKDQVDEGVRAAEETGVSMTQIQGGTKRVLDAIHEISDALSEQTQASGLIAQNIEKVAKMSEENHLAVDDMSEAAKYLEHLALELKTSVQRFNV